MIQIDEILYIEVPTPDIDAVRTWLQQIWQPITGAKITTPEGLRLTKSSNITEKTELSLFIWSVQRTTYLKIFRWGEKAFPQESALIKQLMIEIRSKFPINYPKIPEIDLSGQSIFEAIAPYYPQTVHFFQKMPQGEYDLQRVYWWEKRWRESVRNPQTPKQVIFETESATEIEGKLYDLIYIGGALGAVHAAVMAKLGYRVLLIERLPFGRMNREWNISRSEFQRLIELGLFTPEEFESLIAREYQEGFNKFFDGNNPPHLKAAVLHTPTVLNIALDSAKLLQLCGEKLRKVGGEIWDETEFIRADLDSQKITLQVIHLPSQTAKQAQ